MLTGGILATVLTGLLSYLAGDIGTLLLARLGIVGSKAAAAKRILPFAKDALGAAKPMLKRGYKELKRQHGITDDPVERARMEAEMAEFRKHHPSDAAEFEFDD